MLAGRIVRAIRERAGRAAQRVHRGIRVHLASPAAVTSSHALRVCRLDDFAAYQAMARGNALAAGPEAALAAAHPDGRFTVEGHCWVDAKPVAFEVDYNYAAETAGARMPNWRERLVCPLCGLNNRQRASLQLAGETLGLAIDSRVYITEQLTAVFAALKSRYPALVGSEFLGPGHAPGNVDSRGIRHEDLTRLSLPDASVDAVLSFDVLEHIPDVDQALRECWRVLAPGGVLMLSVPFLEDTQPTRLRAEVTADGSVVHHHPPQFHGDPVNPGAGVLCYREFGWDVLQQLRNAGFVDATALAYRSEEFGYLGGWPIVFAAWKGRDAPKSPASEPTRDELLGCAQVGEFAWHAFTGDPGVARQSEAHFEVLQQAMSVHGDEHGLRRLLEVGAYRHFMGDLACERMGIEATLTDIAASSLRDGLAAAQGAGLAAITTRVAADFHDLPFADGYFDLAFVSSSIHHTRRPEQVIREMFRTLRPGGLLVVNNEPCARLACFYQFASNRPESQTAFERHLAEQGLLTLVSSPFPGARAELLFGMVENDRIPVGLYREEFLAEGEILDWRLAMHGLEGGLERELEALPGHGQQLRAAVEALLVAKIESAAGRIGEIDRLLEFTLPSREQVAELAGRLVPALEQLRAAPPSEAGLLRAALWGAALHAVIRKRGKPASTRGCEPRFRRILDQADGIWVERAESRGISALLGRPLLPDIFRCRDIALLSRWFPATDWSLEQEASGLSSLVNRGGRVRIQLGFDRPAILVLRSFTVAEPGGAFEIHLSADGQLLETQLAALNESRLARAWLEPGTRQVEIELRKPGGSLHEHAGALRLGVAQCLPIGLA